MSSTIENADFPLPCQFYRKVFHVQVGKRLLLQTYNFEPPFERKKQKKTTPQHPFTMRIGPRTPQPSTLAVEASKRFARFGTFRRVRNNKKPE